MSASRSDHGCTCTPGDAVEYHGHRRNCPAVNTHQALANLAYYKRTCDSYGMPVPFTGPRFTIEVIGHEPGEEDGWRYKLRFIDHAYLDSDGFPMDAIAAGNSWAEAFATAGQWIDHTETGRNPWATPTIGLES